MKVLYKEDYFEMKNKDNAIDFIFTKANQIMTEEGRIFSHLLIDGIEVYENHETYINEHANEIMIIEIVTKKMADIIIDISYSILEYLERAIPSIEELVNNSYESFSHDTWNGINELGEGMQFILQFATLTRTSNLKPKNWDKIDVNINQCESAFKQLLDAIESKDTVFISDILSYEIIPAYQALIGDLSSFIQSKEFNKYVN
ncbi:hypothetical protein [Paucisalibacillus globulus]|uniref:hypothetical protein n=1 Tax=Paucisalibacillus globulus TaxID=351095 RepID=UPI0004113483|nr:hypothetical protein [Paucisalibacillus globulus]